MISTRYVPVVAVLLGIALVPTILHSYIGVTSDDGRTAAAIPARLAGLDAMPSGRSVQWARGEFASTDFFERRYGTEVTLFVARSLDAKRLYHHPELVIAHGEDYLSAQIVRPRSHPSVPLHVLSGSDKTAVYAVLCGDQFIEDPIRFQLKSALGLVFGPARSTTLLFGRAPRAYTADTLESSPVVAVVLSALDSFIGQQAAPLR